MKKEVKIAAKVAVVGLSVVAPEVLPLVPGIEGNKIVEKAVEETIKAVARNPKEIAKTTKKTAKAVAKLLQW